MFCLVKDVVILVIIGKIVNYVIVFLILVNGLNNVIFSLLIVDFFLLCFLRDVFKFINSGVV